MLEKKWISLFAFNYLEIEILNKYNKLRWTIRI